MVTYPPKLYIILKLCQCVHVLQQSQMVWIEWTAGILIRKYNASFNHPPTVFTYSYMLFQQIVISTLVKESLLYPAILDGRFVYMFATFQCPVLGQDLDRLTDFRFQFSQTFFSFLSTLIVTFPQIYSAAYLMVFQKSSS